MLMNNAQYEAENDSDEESTSSDGEPDRMSQRAYHRSVINKYYTSGSWYGQSASATIYILATVLERVDCDLLW